LAVLTPYFQLYLRARGYSPSSVGILLGCFSIAEVAGPLLIGRIVDRGQNYRLLLLSVLTASIVFILPFHFVSGLWLGIPLVTVFGLAARTTGSLTDAFVGRIIADPVHRYGYIRVWGSLGFIATSLFLQVTKLVDGKSALSILLALIATTLLALGASALLPGGVLPLREKKSYPSDGFGKMRSPFWLGVTIICLGYIGMASHYSFFSLYIQDTLGLSTVSLFWAVSTTAEVPFIFFSGSIIRRLGIAPAMAMSLAAIVVRLTIYALFPVYPVILAAQLLHAFTFGLFHATSVAFIFTTVPEKHRATGMALFVSLSGSGGLFLGSTVGGFIIEAWGFSVLYLLYAIPPLLALTLLMAKGKSFPNT